MTGEIKFTKESLLRAEIPPAGKRSHIYDRGAAKSERGLLLRVTDRGERSFYIRHKLNGKSIWYRLPNGEFPSMTIEQARELASAYFHEIRSGKDPARARKQSREEMTLQELFNHYIDRHAKTRCRTVIDMQDNFRRYAATLANKRLSEITYRDASALQEKLFKTKGLYTANRTVQLLRAIYNKGRKWRIFEGENPFGGLELHQEEKRKRFLTNEEVGRLLVAAEEELPLNSAIHDFIKLSLSTGARKANILAMSWAHIDMDAQTWTIPGNESKNGEKQTILLHAEDIEILERRRQEQKEKNVISKFVFEGSGKSKHLEDPKRAWQKIREKAGIEDCTIHDLRRSLGSAMASSGFNLAVIKHALNHKDMKTTAHVYAHANDEAVLHARSAVKATWAAARQQAEQKPKVKPFKAAKK